MPGFDATGPRGQGPGSGWGMGPCGAGLRRGGGRGRGLGPGIGCDGGGLRRGYGSWGFGRFTPGPVAAGSPQGEVTALRQEADALKAELEAVQKRLAELEGAQP